MHVFSPFNRIFYNELSMSIKSNKKMGASPEAPIEIFRVKLVIHSALVFANHTILKNLQETGSCAVLRELYLMLFHLKHF